MVGLVRNCFTISIVHVKQIELFYMRIIDFAKASQPPVPVLILTVLLNSSLGPARSSNASVSGFVLSDQIDCLFLGDANAGVKPARQ